MRDPDIKGHFGQAWIPKISVSAPRDWDATLACYLVNRPGAHPLWSWWMVALVHLRPIPGESRPAHKRYPEAEYEIMFLALDPDVTVDVDAEQAVGSIQPLMPPDLIEQFHGVSDDQAREILRGCVRIICDGASPDQDYRSWWKLLIRNTLQHVVLGEHPKAAS